MFVYSRTNYGKSSPGQAAARVNFMHEEAIDVLPRVLAAIGFQRGILFGHSDGASSRPFMPAAYRTSCARPRAHGAAFLHRGGLAQIRRANEDYQRQLREKLKRWHDDVDSAFHSWNGPWLNPEFRAWDITEVLGYIRVPILIVQGGDDQYGTTKQVEVAEQECYCPVEMAIAARRAPFAPPRCLRPTLETAVGLHQSPLRDHHEGRRGLDSGVAA